VSPILRASEDSILDLTQPTRPHGLVSYLYPRFTGGEASALKSCSVQGQLAALGWTRIRCAWDVLTSASRSIWIHLGYRELTRQRDDAG